jgi:tetratricopeptide (TPR) repeat protein
MKEETDELAFRAEDFNLKKHLSPFTTSKAIYILIIVGFLLFFNAFFNGFVGDDNTQIVGNPAVRSIANIPNFFFQNRLNVGGDNKLGGDYYKPLMDSSFTLTYSLFGPIPFIFHFIQISLFITNSCLVFLVFKQFLDKKIAFLLALIFLVHPINSENALYIATTQDTLFFFFGMLSLLILQNGKSKKSLILSSIFLLCSILSKETGGLFFIVNPLYLFLFKRKFFLPFLGGVCAVSLGYILLRLISLGTSFHAAIVAPIDRLSLPERLINAPAIIFYYIQSFIFPLNLTGSIQWVYTNFDLPHFFGPLILDLIFLSLLTYLLFLFHKNRQQKYFHQFLFFSVWLILGLAFHLQIYPLDQTAAVRWLYFPVFGLLGCIGVILASAKINWKNTWVFAICVILSSAFFLRTFIRTFDFRNDFVLASHDTAVSPSYNAEYIISHNFYERGDMTNAKLHAEKSIQLFPYITNYTNLGAIESSMGDYQSAKGSYLNALKYGDDKLPFENLAALSLVYGDNNENISFLRNTALKKYPNDGELWFYLAVLEFKFGDQIAGKSDLQQAVSNHTQNPDLDLIEYIMQNNKPLEYKVDHGNIQFYTEK